MIKNKIGKSIHNHFIQNKVQAEFGKKIFFNLSRDLKIGEQLLYQIVQFYKAYPHFKPKDNVTWSHYRRLASIVDKRTRKKIETKVSKEKLSNRPFDILIQEYKQTLNSKKKLQPIPVEKLKPKKGKLYTYKLFRNEHSNNLLMDLGFRISRDTHKKKFKTDFVESKKIDEAYSIKSVDGNKKNLYTFVAYINNIVDGDTIWFDIDLGFNTWIKHKARIKGIEAPEIDTKEGQRSRRYVVTTLKDLSFVVIKSNGRDKFGRYLMDVYYKKDEHDPNIVLKNGTYLNQELLDKGLATVYED